MKFKKIAFVASHHAEAQKALAELKSRYGNVAQNKADVVVALGGDGFMLRALHANMKRGTPVYGMNRGSVGFLMNEFRADDLVERLEASEPATLSPLQMKAKPRRGRTVTALAINEVSLLRETRLAAKLRLFVDGVERMKELICDGVIISTPAGSTAYNASAHGPIIPMGAEVLALTPISAYRPRRWRGALLPVNAEVRVDVLETADRPVSAAADYTEVRDVESITICSHRSLIATLLYDPEHDLEERIIKEQFDP
ncbi:MAG: NAD kinase [Rhodospirillales bacterium]